MLQWDKDDCAAAGLVKFDLLGLGMLSALHYTIDLIGRHHSRELELATLPLDDEGVYDMLCRADSVGVFQVESRAQMATLPRLRPREFYDLVVEVALIRPGPIQGGSVHPFIRRRQGQEPVTYPHPLLEPALERTLGVPLFQEQLMQMAIDVAGFTPAVADQLRRAMGSKRSHERMAALARRPLRGDGRATGSPATLADEIYVKLAAFANFGFPESHAMSFAYLVYASAWFKRYYPAAFCAALLNAQPMGFYSPQTLVDDARRHGVVVRRPDINAVRGRADAGAARTRRGSAPVAAAARLGAGDGPRSGSGCPRCGRSATRWPSGSRPAGRTGTWPTWPGGPSLTAAQLEALATAGAFACLGLTRREALWAAGAAAQDRPDRLAGLVVGADAPTLPGLNDGGARRWPTCGRPGCRRTATRPSSSATGWPRPACSPPAVCPLWTTGRGCWSAGSSPTGSGRRPRAGSPSSTWRTRPAWST